jgi:hypothetical protein
MPNLFPRAPIGGLRARLILGAVLLSTGSLAMAAAPVISGAPYSYTVKVGSWWSFTPKAADADGDPLTFSVANKPSWMSIDTKTGKLTGLAKTTGKWANITVSVSDGTTKVALKPFTVTAWAQTANTAPTISGTPAKTAMVGTAYNFQPTASDANGDALGFTIANKPSWASFSTSTGRLSGTPTTAATHSSIVISVSDGKATQSLPAFSITVAAPAAPTVRAATLSWTAPTQNTDGTALSSLAGYRIYYGTSSTALTQVIDVRSAGITTYVLENLAPSTYYFAVRAYDSAGAESTNSNVVSKIVQ